MNGRKDDGWKRHVWMNERMGGGIDRPTDRGTDGRKDWRSDGGTDGEIRACVWCIQPIKSISSLTLHTYPRKAPFNFTIYPFGQACSHGYECLFECAVRAVA